ncbi:type IV toxin-antitoxin system AbiEi family antitoxin [Thioalkalivibrio thiocyanoxidans]|uniref:type IV toxin-antitoxin system AbiEi family antitoxin n=1 Tax=Thioalkalivibrio thiocyanoxidans TaxID=152475 RepID=UPI0003757831|nr:type IV toxin-antitoxin system AbiEi family antitoxin [Thioalkalivibrio thiocyanoxidans]
MVLDEEPPAVPPLLQRACERLESTTGLQPELGHIAEDGRSDGERALPVFLRFGPSHAGRRFQVYLVLRLTPADPGLIATRHDKERPALIISEYVNPKMADRLQDMDIGFLDLAGNAYINAPPVYVFIKGKKPAATEYAHREPAAHAAFQGTGLRIVFALLCAPHLASATYREIADAAGVSLGSASRALHALRDQGFLLDTGRRTRRLHNHPALAERWTLAYPDQLRRKTFLGRYRAANPKWWQDASLEPYLAAWGGEVAAARLTDYLVPERISVHTRMSPAPLLAAFGLRKDPAGDIELHKSFWPPECNTDAPDLAPRLLVYAELLASGHERNIETARMLYEQGLAGRLEPD